MQYSLDGLVGEFAVAGAKLPEPRVVLQRADDGDQVSGGTRQCIVTFRHLMTGHFYFS